MAEDVPNICRIFLASPGGVENERKKCREVITKAEAVLGRLRNVHLQVIGWEDVSIGAGRAQDRINPEVECCDLFIGIVGHLWGTPTGDHTSGFKEEFELALRLNKDQDSKRPAVWVFFKEVPQDKLEDPGDQLRKVLAFKADVKGNERLFYKEFTEANWGETLLAELVQYIQQVSPPSHSTVAEGQSESALRSVDARGDGSAGAPFGEQAEGAPGYPEEVVKLVQALHQGLGTRWPQEATPDQIARLHLLAKAWFSEQRPAALLDVHELNIYYKAREGLHLSAAEWWLLLRSAIADEHGTMPGMFWIKGATDQSIASLLFEKAKADCEEVQLGALRLLARTDYAPPQGWLESLVADDSSRARLGLLEMLRLRLPVWGIDVASRLMGDSDFLVSAQAEDVRLLLLAAYDPDAALREAASRAVIIDSLGFSRLRTQLSEVSVAELRAGLSAKNAEVRAMAGEELAQRGELTREEAVQLSEDDSASAAQVGLACLLQAADEPDEQLLNTCKEKSPSLLQQREMTRLRAMAADDLLSRVRFYDIGAPLAYRVLGLQHFDSAGDRLRSDLEDGFQSLRVEHERALLGEFSASVPDGVAAKGVDVIAPLRKFDDFLAKQFMEAALAGLAEHGDAQDAASARRALVQEDAPEGLLREAAKLLARFGGRADAFRLLIAAEKAYGEIRDEVRAAAASILKRHGTRADSDCLVALAKEADGELKAMLANVAVELAPGLKGAAGQLLEGDDPALVRLAFRSLLGKGQATRKRRATQLLSSKSNAIRDAAVSFLANTCSDGELRAILDEYLQLPTYYYSVVCGLDRLLYAPGALGTAFRAEIKAIVRDPKIERKSRRGRALSALRLRR